MAILASIEVDETDGSLKIKNFKDALSDLGADALRSAKNVTTAGQQTTQSTQQQATALQQLIKQHRDTHNSTQQVAQGYTILHQQLRAGASVSDLQAKALQQLAAQTQNNTKFSTQFAGSAQALAGHLRAGTTVTEQQAKQLQTLATQQVGASNGARQHASSLQDLNIKAAALAAGLGMVAAGAYSTLRQAGDLAARVETLGVVMGIAGKNANLNTQTMRTQVEGIRALGITTQESTDAVVQFTQAQLKLSDATKLARAAQDLAVVAGENSSQTFKRLTTAVQIQQPILLRQVGITTGLEQIYREYAQTLGKTWQQLDAVEKKQAFINKILAEGEKVAGSYEASMTTAGKQIGSFARFSEEAKLALGQGLLPVMLDAVKIATAVLKAWTSLPEPIQRTVTALMAASVAMLAFLGALAGAKFLGIVTAFGTLATNINYVVVAARNGIPVMTAFMGIMGPMNVALLAITATLGLVTAAYVYLRKEQELNVDKHLNAAAATQAEIDKLEASHKSIGKSTESIKSLSAEYETLKGKTTLTRDEQDRLRVVTYRLDEEQAKYNRTLGSLNKLAPEAVLAIRSQETAYNDLGGAIAEVIKKRQQDMRLSAAGATAELQRAKDNEAAATTELRTAQDRARWLQTAIEAAREGERTGVAFFKVMKDGQEISIRTAGAVGAFEKQLKAQTGAVADASAKAQEAAGAVNRYAQNVDDLNNSLPENIQRQKEWTRTLVAKEIDDAAIQYKNLGERLRIAGMSMADLQKSATPDELKAKLDTMNDAWDKHSKKIEENKKKYDTAFTSALDTVRSTSNVSRAALAAVEQGLGEVGRGTDEYAARVLRAKETINKFNLLTEDQKKGLRNIAIAVEDLKKLEIDKEMEKWEKKAKDVSESFQKMAHDIGEGFTRSMGEFEKAQGKSFVDVTRQTNEKVLAIQRELSDSSLKIQRSEVDQRLMENGRYFEQFRKNIGEEIRLIRLRHTEEVEAIEERAEAARREVMELARRTVERFKIEYDAETAIAKARDALRDPSKTAAQKEAELRAIKGNLEKQVNAYRDSEIAIIDNATRASVKRADVRALESEKWVDALQQAASQSLRIEKENADAIKRDHSLMWQALSGMLQTYVSMFLQSFGSILTGARSFKDVFVDIWQSIKNSIMGVLDSILQRWIQNAQRMAAAGAVGPNGFSAGGGMSGFFGGLAAPFSKGTQAVIPGMNGGASMVTLAKPGIFQTSGLAGGALAAGAGGLVGYGLGGMFDSRSKGALAGAAGGAATGAMMGMMLGPLGAGAGALIGGAAGLIGGLFSGGKNQRAEANAVKEARKELLLTFGQGREGLEKLRQAAAEADFDVSKLMSTKKTKDFEAELKKLNEAIGLKKGREELIKTAGGMETLQKQAQLLGFNIDKVLNEKTLEGFNKGVEELNKALEAQQKRLENLGKAAEGIQMRVMAMQARLTRNVSEILKGVPDELVTKMREEFESAQSKGFEGGLVQFILGNAKKFNLDKEIIEKLKALGAATQEEFNKVGRAMSATFGAVLRETGDIMQAMEAVGPSLDILIRLRDELGLKIPESMARLIELREAMTDNEDVVMALSGIVSIVQGLGDAGRLTADIFNDMGADAAAQFELLQQRGVSTEMSLLMMQPTLQALWEAQKKYGFATDESTQKMINMGVEHGLVGEQFQSINQQMLDILVIIAEVLGADIPDAYRRNRDAAREAGDKAEDAADQAYDGARRVEDMINRGTQRWKEWRDAAIEAGQDAEAAMGGAAEGHSPTGIKQVVVRLRESQQLFRQFKDEFVAGSREMEHSAASAGDAMVTPEGSSQQGGSQVVYAGPSSEEMAQKMAAAVAAAVKETGGKGAITELHIHLAANDTGELEGYVEQRFMPKFLEALGRNAGGSGTAIAEIVRVFTPRTGTEG
jgi:hypothetical protein